MSRRPRRLSRAGSCPVAHPPSLPPSARRARTLRAWHRLCWLPLLGLGGCSVLSVQPTWELFKAVGTAGARAGLQYGASASETVYHLHGPFDTLCIEYNPAAQVGDIVPSLQRALKDLRIESRLYPPGLRPSACAQWLRYTATIDWDTPPFSSEPSAYLQRATLTLETPAGRVLSSSSYVAGEGLFSGRWSTTDRQLAPVVGALVTGFER